MPAVFGPYKEDSTLLRRTGQFKRKEREHDDRREAGSELQELDDVLGHAYILAMKRNVRSGDCRTCLSSQSPASRTISTVG